MPILNRRRAILFLTLAALPRPAFGQFGNLPARLRLVGGTPQADGTLIAGAHVALDPGWKTYWRIPGDSGIAPAFDWSASRNLREARVLYPAPERFSDGYGDILGYKDEIVFPIRITPLDAGRPVELALALQFGLCEKLCIPANASARASFGRVSPPMAETALVERFRARVPRAVPTGSAVTQWVVDRAAGQIAFAARLDGGTRHAVIERAEGGRPLPLPRLETLPDGSIRGRLAFDAVEPGAAGGFVRITVVGSELAVEETRGLD